MPTHDPLAAARRAAKSLARLDDVTHQQALDQIARDAGHAHWAAMTKSHEGDTISGRDLAVTADVVMETTATMREAQKRPAPPAAPKVPTLADVQRDMERLMADPGRRAGLKISEWIGGIMRKAVEAVDATVPKGKPKGLPIRNVPMTPKTMAEAIDPDGGPYENEDRITVRCPVHDDANPSLVIGGRGDRLAMKCMAGCDDDAVREAGLNALIRSATKASAFLAANARHGVIAGGGRGQGGMGGTYTLTDGSHHSLTRLECGMLPEGGPRWTHHGRHKSAERLRRERHEAEVARTEALGGTVDGWGWWVGRDGDTFDWGGPYKTRDEAVSVGNGACSEKGEVYHVVQARTDDEKPDEDGVVAFTEQRGLKRCRAQ